METISIYLFFLSFVFFVVIGSSVTSALLGAGIIALYAWPNVDFFKLMGSVIPDTFYSVSKYSLSLIPIYTVMSSILVKGRVIDDLFAVVFRIFGGRRFFLGSGIILLGGLLGAVSGSGAAIAAALATAASVPLYNFGYSKPFALSLTAIGGSLAAIIPPSLIIIVYGSLTETSIGFLFMGSFIPGFLCIGVYILMLAIYEKFVPSATWDINSKVDTTSTPAGDSPVVVVESSVFKKSLPSVIFILVLLAFIFGGIYGGIVTAGEAGSVGAFVSFVGMFLMKRINLKDLKESLIESAKVSAMVMSIVMSAQIFGRFMAISLVPRKVLALMTPFIDTPIVIIGFVCLIFFILGCFLEAAAIMIMTVPVVMPLLVNANVDLIWFGVIGCMCISLGLLTPPLGLSVYCAGAAVKYPTDKIFKYAFPFAFVSFLIVTPLLIIFPELVTWLPSLMMK